MAIRQAESRDGNVLFACSICGIPAFYPSEMKYRADRTFMCFRHSDTTTNLEEARKQGVSTRKADEVAPRFPVGTKPDWYP